MGSSGEEDEEPGARLLRGPGLPEQSRPGNMQAAQHVAARQAAQLACAAHSARDGARLIVEVCTKFVPI